MLGIALLAGCSPSDPAPAHHPYDWTDAAPILGAHCGGCHQPGGVSGLSLATWADVYAARDVIEFEIQSGAMPPWPAAPGDYAFRGDPTLSDHELDVLTSWIDRDAPLGKGDPDAPITAPPLDVLPETDVTLSMPEPYTPDAEVTDDYRCFVLDQDGLAAGDVRGFQVSVGNPAVVHHLRLVAVFPPDGGAKLRALQDHDPTPGFACGDSFDPSFGAPSLTFGGWLPGAPATIYPDDSGIPLVFGAVFVAIVHYHPSASNHDPDRTTVQLWTTPQVEHPVEPVHLTDNDWRLPPGDGGLVIPAGAADVDWSTTQAIRDLPMQLMDPGVNGVDLLSVQFHMHKLGARGSVTLVRGGERSTLLEIPAWNFDWQLSYWLTEPLHLDPDDTLTLDCQYDNSDGTQTVLWGEGTADEMCSAMVTAMKPAAP